MISDVFMAKQLICRLILNNKNATRPWSYASTAALSRQLPIPLAEIQLVAWWRHLPDDPKDPDLSRRQICTERGLCENWSDEVTRANAYRVKLYGLDVPQKKEPPRWKEFFRWKNDENVVLPASFHDLSPTIKREYERDFATFVKATTG